MTRELLDVRPTGSVSGICDLINLDACVRYWPFYRPYSFNRLSQRRFGLYLSLEYNYKQD